MPVPNGRLDGQRGWYAGMRARIEALLAGRVPDDPLYLTNRTWRKKLAVAAAVILPLAMILALITIGAADVFRLHKVDPYEHPLTETKAAAPAPRLPDPKLAPADLEVVNIRIARDAGLAMVTGVVRNNTGEKVGAAEVSYYLTDAEGSLVETESVDVQNVAAHGSVTFHLPVKAPNARSVIVREVHAN